MKTKIELNRFDGVDEHLREFNAKKLNMNYPILLYGSSTFTLWQENGLDEKHLSPLGFINNGFGGSTAEDALYHYQALVKEFKPKILVYYEGSNDISLGYNPHEIMTYNEILFDWARQDMPDIKIVIIPTKQALNDTAIWGKITHLNDLMKNYCDIHDDSQLVDIDTLLFDENGIRRDDIYLDDLLHHNEKGYSLLKQCLKPVLEGLMNEL